MGRVLFTQSVGSSAHKDSISLSLLPSGRNSLSEITNLSPLFHRLSASSIAGSPGPTAEQNAIEPSSTHPVPELADQNSVQPDLNDQPDPVLPPLSSQTPDSVWASNSGLLIQTLASLVQQSESNVEGEVVSGPSLLQQIGEAVAGPNNATFSPDRPRAQFSSDALLAALDLLCYRNASPAVPSIHPSASSTSVKQGQQIQQQHCTICPLRVYHPKKRQWCNFLVVSGVNTSPTNLSRQTSGTQEATGAASEVVPGGSRLLSIYQMDKFCRHVARCQDNGILELAKLQAITSLLQSRGDQTTVCSTTSKAIQNQGMWTVLFFYSVEQFYPLFCY